MIPQEGDRIEVRYDSEYRKGNRIDNYTGRRGVVLKSIPTLGMLRITPEGGGEWFSVHTSDVRVVAQEEKQ